MKVTGIVAEYNPFHNGHKYQIEQARKLTGADYIIVALSGNFTQRGTPAILNKYDRAKMALLNGADLVVELPSFYACASAEYFAKGTMTLFEKLGVVDAICFGSECGDLNPLTEIAKVLAYEPEDYKRELRASLRNGYSYPSARNNALLASLPGFAAYSTVICYPNNILGIEYIKALLQLESNIIPYTNERVGSGYHDYRLSQGYSSAISIRHALRLENPLEYVRGQMPENCFEILKEAYGKATPVFQDDFTSIIKYRLLLEQENSYMQFADVSEELSNKMKKYLFTTTDITSFCERLKSKDLTHARINRCLGHILLDLKQPELEEFLKEGTIFYGRILGFRADSAPLLTELKKCSSIPLITKVADAKNQLSEIGLKQFEKDMQASHIYESVVSTKFGVPMNNEYQREIIKC